MSYTNAAQLAMDIQDGKATLADIESVPMTNSMDAAICDARALPAEYRTSQSLWVIVACHFPLTARRDAIVNTLRGKVVMPDAVTPELFEVC